MLKSTGEDYRATVEADAVADARRLRVEDPVDTNQLAEGLYSSNSRRPVSVAMAAAVDKEELNLWEQVAEVAA